MMEFAHPPQVVHLGSANMSTLPPSFNTSPQNIVLNPLNSVNATSRPSYLNTPRQPFRPLVNLQRPLPGPLANMTLEDFDGKRLRKSVMRKTVDYNAAIITAIENRIWQRDFRDRRALQPDVMYYPDLMPPPDYPDNPINCVTTRFVKTATNKMRCPIFCMAWTPEGRRLVTGASSGEFTLWNGLTFNFETILQAHDSPVRCMVWSHNDNWMVTGDHAGYVKYWQSNMNNVKMFQAHKEALRGISFSPSDSKFVTCSDDGTLRIWDFLRYQEERILRGHGADVKCVHWHPQKGLIISGSKDNQQPIKLWDAKTGQSLATLHAHKATVMDLKWNENGNWLITASRDHLLKLFDLRNLNQEVQTFRGHKKEASSVAWHPIHEGLFCSGGSDGAIMFWHVGADKEVGAIEQAHDSIVWTLAWHPLGHILCSGSNDHTSKFWTRNRPGDQMRDKYNLNTLPAGIAGDADIDIDELSMIPGMGPEDKVEYIMPSDNPATIPGLDLDSVTNADEKLKSKKVPYSKPIPRNFQAQWNETISIDDQNNAFHEVITHLENNSGVVPLQKIASNASGLIMCGKFVAVEPGSRLESVLADGPRSLYEFILDGNVPELHDVLDKVRIEYKAIKGDYCSDDNEDSHNEPIRPQPLIPDLRDIRLDQDMRQINKFGDSDMRVNSDSDFRSGNNFRQFDDQDMRQFGTSSKRDTRDKDFRSSFNPDTDFRKFPSDDNDYDDRDWGENGSIHRSNSNFNPNFGNNNFRPEEDDDDESWNQNSSGDNYRNNRGGRSRGGSAWGGSRNNSRKPRRGGRIANKRPRGHANDKQGPRDLRRSRY